MAFGIIGDIVEGLGDVVLGPKGTRGASIGSAIGSSLGGPAGSVVGAAVGSNLSSSIASGSRGQEAVATPTPAQSPRYSRESAFSGANQAGFFSSQRTFVPTNTPPAVRVIKDVLGDGAGGPAMDFIPDINITSFWVMILAWPR